MAVNNVYKKAGLRATAAVSPCETTRFTSQNGLFWRTKQAISHGKTPHTVNRLEINGLEDAAKYGREMAQIAKYLYKEACPHGMADAQDERRRRLVAGINPRKAILLAAYPRISMQTGWIKE